MSCFTNLGPAQRLLSCQEVFRFLLTLVVASCALSVPSSVRATVLADITIEDMANDAAAIVMGEVVQVDTHLMTLGDRMEPWTTTTVRVERWLKGSGSELVTIHERGGQWQGGGMHIEGTPEYRARERVLVFLWRDPFGQLRTYGMAQGRFVIRLGVSGVPTMALRDLLGIGLATWSGGQMSVRHGQATAIRLDELLSRVASVLTPSIGPRSTDALDESGARP